MTLSVSLLLKAITVGTTTAVVIAPIPKTHAAI